MSVACLLTACATKPETPSAFEPAIGHHQPLPTSPSEDESTSDDESQRDASEESGPSEPPALPTADEEQLCQHIVAVVQSESADPATADQTAELLASCELALAHDRRRLGEEEFARRAECMFSATTVADFSACKSEPTP